LRLLAGLTYGLDRQAIVSTRDAVDEAMRLRAGASMDQDGEVRHDPLLGVKDVTKITKKQLYYLCRAHTRNSKGNYKRYLGSLAQRVRQAGVDEEGDDGATASRTAPVDPQEDGSTVPTTGCDYALTASVRRGAPALSEWRAGAAA
jgi:hypothetical protein